MAVKRRGVPAAGPPAAKRACREEKKEKEKEKEKEEEGEFNGARFKALLRDPATARKGEGPGRAWGGGGRRAGAVLR